MHGIEATLYPQSNDPEGVTTEASRTYPELFNRSDCLYGLIAFINPIPLIAVGQSIFNVGIIIDYDFRWLILALLFSYYLVFNVYPFFRIKNLTVPGDDTSRGFPFLRCDDVLFVVLFFIPVVNFFWWVLVTFCVVEKVSRLHRRFVTGDPVKPSLNRRSIVGITIWILILLSLPYCITIVTARFNLNSAPKYDLLIPPIRWIFAPLFAILILALISMVIPKRDRIIFFAVASFSYLAITPALYMLAHFFYPGEYGASIICVLAYSYFWTMDYLKNMVQDLYNRLGYGE